MVHVQNCGACHIWQGEVKSLKAKLEKALQPKVTFAVDPNLFKKSLNPSYEKYSFVEEIPMRKSKWIHHHGLCHYYCHSGHTIVKCKFRTFLVPKGIYQWMPKCNIVSAHTQGPNENWVPTSLFWYCRLSVLHPRKEDGLLTVGVQGTWRVTYLYS